MQKPVGERYRVVIVSGSRVERRFRAASTCSRRRCWTGATSIRTTRCMSRVSSARSMPIALVAAIDAELVTRGAHRSRARSPAMPLCVARRSGERRDRDDRAGLSWQASPRRRIRASAQHAVRRDGHDRSVPLFRHARRRRVFPRTRVRPFHRRRRLDRRAAERHRRSLRRSTDAEHGNASLSAYACASVSAPPAGDSSADSPGFRRLAASCRRTIRPRYESMEDGHNAFTFFVARRLRSPSRCATRPKAGASR